VSSGKNPTASSSHQKNTPSPTPELESSPTPATSSDEASLAPEEREAVPEKTPSPTPEPQLLPEKD